MPAKGHYQCYFYDANGFPTLAAGFWILGDGKYAGEGKKNKGTYTVGKKKPGKGRRINFKGGAYGGWWGFYRKVEGNPVRRAPQQARRGRQRVPQGELRLGRLEHGGVASRRRTTAPAATSPSPPPARGDAVPSKPEASGVEWLAASLAAPGLGECAYRTRGTRMRKGRCRALLAVGALVVGITLVQANAASAATTIRPGERSVVADETAVGSCTLGFVFDGIGARAGRTYIGTAAHCVTHVGQDVALLNAPLDVFGDVAVIGNLATSAGDWALIEVRPAFVSRVSAGMLGYPQYPTGATSSRETTVGDSVRLTNLVIVPRTVSLMFDDAEIYRVSGTQADPPSVVPSDSGGPLVHAATGKALGGVSRGLNCAVPPAVCEEYEGPTVEGILAKAAAAGFPVALRTVQ